MLLFKSRILMLGTGLMLALPPGHAADLPKPIPSDKGQVAATVNGTAISEYRVAKLVKQRGTKGQADNTDLRKEIIEQLSLQLLLAQEAVKGGLNKSPDLLDHIDLTVQSILATAFVQDYQKKNPVSEDMLKAEYEKFQARTAGSEYKARHILVDSEAEARDIIAKVNANPQDFEALAKESSKDPGTKAKGGDLGWFDPGGMVPEFSAAVTTLEKGSFSKEPVKSKFGYHVIALDDSRPKAIPPLDKVKPMLQQQLQEQDLKKLFDDIKAKATIEIVQATVPATPSANPGKPATKGK